MLEPGDDSGMIRRIRQLADSLCNSMAFTRPDADLFVLRLEWNRVEPAVADLYESVYPQRFRPRGTFVCDSNWQTDEPFQGFYSDNKHFEFVVAEALLGSQRQHVTFQSAESTYPFLLQPLEPRFLTGDDDRQVDYEQLGQIISQTMVSGGLGSDPTVSASNSRRSCQVASPWNACQTIGDIDYQQRIVMDVRETSGHSLMPDRTFRGNSDRLEFCSFVELRRADQPERVERFGPVDYTLVGHRKTSQVDSDLNVWSIEQVDRLKPENLSPEMLTSRPDPEYDNKIANSRTRYAGFDPIRRFQSAIRARVEQAPDR